MTAQPLADDRRALARARPTARMLLLPEQADVADPIGQTIGAYRHCADADPAGVKHHVERLKSELYREVSRRLTSTESLTCRTVDRGTA